MTGLGAGAIMYASLLVMHDKPKEQSDTSGWLSFILGRDDWT